MHNQEYNRPGGSDVPPIFDILGNQQQNQDFSEPKKQKYQQQNEGKKQKGRNESPTTGIKRSNYFPPQNPENNNNDDLEDETPNIENSYVEQNEQQMNIPPHQQGRRKNMQMQMQEGEQMQYGNPQGPGNFRPQQLKQQGGQGQGQNMPPHQQNYYGQNQQQQQQFFNNNQQQQNPNVPFQNQNPNQKRKSNKGQNPNFNPNQQPGNPKNFPNTNPNFNNNPQNQQNPYNRKGSGGAPPELNPVGQMSPTNANGKFNKNQSQGQNRQQQQYNDKNAQRAYNMPPNIPNMHHNMPQVQVQVGNEMIPNMGMENFSPQDNMKNPKVQSPILFNNNTPNPTQMMAHAFHNQGFPDMRQGGGGYILPGPGPEGQQFVGGGYNQSPQMNQMMNKQPPPPQFVSGGNFPYQNPSLVDNSNLQNTANVKTFFYDLSDSLQKQNMKLKADVYGYFGD